MLVPSHISGKHAVMAVCSSRSSAKSNFFKKDYYPIKRMSFEGFQVCVPNNPDAVLTALFGDYMQIPPKEKRVVHSSKIEFYSER